MLGNAGECWREGGNYIRMLLKAETSVRKFFARTDLGMRWKSSETREVPESEKEPSSKMRRNSAPFSRA